MKLFKKSLCIALSLLMVFSMFAFSASAVTGAENADKINIKYEVEQVSEAYDYTAVDNDIYAVSVYAKQQNGISLVQVPIHFDKTKFAPLMWADSDPVNNGALGYDGYYADTAENGLYNTEKGDAWSDTSMYNAAGTPETVMAKARYIGLGNPNVTKPDYQVNFYDNTNPAYPSWSKGLDTSTTGFCALWINDNKKAKNAYLNAFENEVIQDWVRLTTLYFIRLPGVTEADAVGAEFGTYDDAAFGSQSLIDISGKPSYFSTTFVEKNPGINYVSNATVAAGPTEPVIEHKGDQVRFHDKNADKVYDGTFDFRCLAAIDKASLEDYLGNVSVDEMEKMIVDAGVVYKTGAKDAFDTTAAQEKIAAHVESKANKTIDTGYVVKSVRYLSTGYNASYYTFNCTVEDIDEVEVNGVGGYSSYAYIAFDEDGNGSADKFIYSNVESHDFTNSGFVAQRENFKIKLNA